MVFKNVISRDNGVPWPPQQMTTKDWEKVPIEYLDIAWLTATQPGILLHALVHEGESWCGDKYPHVIEWKGELYLEDGHHRVMRARLEGRHVVECRVLELG